MHVNLFSFKKVTSYPVVATIKSSGKAIGYSELRLNMSVPILLETILDKVTLRNLTRSAEVLLSYWPPYNYGHVAEWLESCVQESNQENRSTALQKEVDLFRVDHAAQEPTSKRLKNRKNLRTAGSNLCYYKGRRSVYITTYFFSSMCMEGTQATNCRSFSTKIHLDNLDRRVLIAELKQMVGKCKNKGRSYRNLIRIIGSFSTLKLAYLIIKSNPVLSAKEMYNTTLDGITIKILQKISQDMLNGRFELTSLGRAFVYKLGLTMSCSLGVSSLREKILQKAIEIVLTVSFDDTFLNCSHGARLGRNCHIALKHLQLSIKNAPIYT